MAGLPPAAMLQLAQMLAGGQTFGGQKHGGNLFGGNRFGGNTFGGNKFGASAPQSVNVPATPPQLPPFEQPGGSLPPFNPNAPAPQQTPVMPPVNVTAQAPQSAPPAMPPDATTAPPMPPSTQIGAPASPSIMDWVRKLFEQQQAQAGGQANQPEQFRGRFTPSYGEPT